MEKAMGDAGELVFTEKKQKELIFCAVLLLFTRKRE